MYDMEQMLGSRLYREVTAKTGGMPVIADDGKLIPKHRFDCINISLKEHKRENEQLKIQLGQLRAEMRDTAAAEEQIECLKIELGVYRALAEAKVKNFEAVKALIKFDGINSLNVREKALRQLKRLKKEQPYLFDGGQLFRLVPVETKFSGDNL